MSNLIILIVIIFIVRKALKSQPAKKTQQNPQQGVRQNYNYNQTAAANQQWQKNVQIKRTVTSSNQQWQQNVQTSRQTTAPNQQWQQMNEQKRAQAELKERLKKRYKSNGQQDDILSRATANVMENQQDKLELEMENTAIGVTQADVSKIVNAIDIESTSRLMQDVEDLIVMGYQPDLTFERDFVSEGIDMLNRFEMPDTLQGIS